MINSSNKIPTQFFLCQGSGESDFAVQTGSLYHALYRAGIHDVNLRMGASVIPVGSTEIEMPTNLKRGEVVDCIMASCHGEMGEEISAGLILGDLVQKTNDVKCGGIVCELGEKIGEEALKEKLQGLLNEWYVKAYSEQYHLVNIRIYSEGLRVQKKHGTALVALCFSESRYDFRSRHTSYPPFIDHPSSYEKAKYVIQPITSPGASAILEASQHIEDYDIETDNQAFKKGIHTASPLLTSSTPEGMLHQLKPIAVKLFQDQKIPCFLGGDHNISIAVFEALREISSDITILQLDAHADLRPSYGGTPYNHACVMHQAKRHFSNIVQCGIRSMSLRERNAFNPETTFFAADIHANPLWVDDVLDEVGKNVYITLDVSVFDPSIVSTNAPEPNGLTYSQVLKLLKAIAKDRKVVGMDVVELCPQPGNHASEYLLAKLIHQWISFLEK